MGEELPAARENTSPSALGTEHNNATRAMSTRTDSPPLPAVQMFSPPTALALLLCGLDVLEGNTKCTTLSVVLCLCPIGAGSQRRSTLLSAPPSTHKTLRWNQSAFSVQEGKPH
ncbi:hypothetical protein AAFF_G00124800 [Aldrovandia affinis]|uniref:Uncharacterized protein n=1 Tax=Aldrovandia affinis TaxID=143900 RepID=A0AAD7VXP2_9TELE|nr:hypothetical protein AAFF_G00124800 [Aldrovandia affinis]